MTAPLIQSAQVYGTSLYLIFDRSVSVTGGSELNGLTFTINPGATPTVPVYSSTDDNALVATLGAPLSAGQSIDVVYDGLGTIVEAVAPNDPVASFTETTVEYYTPPVFFRAEVGETGNNKLVLHFSEPVGSPTAALTAGLTVTVNGETAAISSAVLNADQTQLIVTLTSNVAYSSTVEIDYDSATGDLRTWPTGALSDFTASVVNNSTDGLPNSSYPLSTAVGSVPTIVAGVASCSITVYLNPIDIELAAKYAPTVYTGGEFGTPGSEIAFVGTTVAISNGLVVSCSFQGTASLALAAALDWRDTVISRLFASLGASRATDQGLSFGSRQIESV